MIGRELVDPAGYDRLVPHRHRHIRKTFDHFRFAPLSSKTCLREQISFPSFIALGIASAHQFHADFASAHCPIMGIASAHHYK